MIIEANASFFLTSPLLHPDWPPPDWGRGWRWRGHRTGGSPWSGTAAGAPCDSCQGRLTASPDSCLRTRTAAQIFLDNLTGFLRILDTLRIVSYHRCWRMDACLLDMRKVWEAVWQLGPSETHIHPFGELEEGCKPERKKYIFMKNNIVEFYLIL